jgi:hypothetical protein
MVGPHVAALDAMWTVYPGSSLAQRRISYGDAHAYRPRPRRDRAPRALWFR